MVALGRTARHVHRRQRPWQGIVGAQRAKLQLEARDLGVDMMWLQMLMQMNGDDKKRAAKRMETLVGQQSDIAVSTGEQVQKTGEMRIRIAVRCPGREPARIFRTRFSAASSTYGVMT